MLRDYGNFGDGNHRWAKGKRKTKYIIIPGKCPGKYEKLHRQPLKRLGKTYFRQR